MIKVLLADSQLLFADCLATALEKTAPDLEVMKDRPVTTDEVLDIVLLRQPDVALIDYRLPPAGGPSIAGHIGIWGQSTKLLLLSWEQGPDFVREALAAGAVGFLPTTLTIDQVAEGIRRAHAGESPVYEEQLKTLVETWGRREMASATVEERLAALTPRELQVLAQLSLGIHIEEVAKRLDITRGTVNVHIHNILAKTQVRSYAEAISLARRSGLIGPGPTAG